MPNAVFWAKFANFGAPWNRCTNAKTPQKERRKCTLNMKMSPAARGRLRLPDLGLWSWTPLGASPKTPVTTIWSPSNSTSHCAVLNFTKNMPCLTPTIKVYAPDARYVFALPCSPCLFWLSSFLYLWRVPDFDNFVAAPSDFRALDIFRAGSLTYLLINYSMRNFGWSLGHYKKLRTGCIVQQVMLSG